MKARVHSIETLGTVDGPGIRFVVFLQGCPLRCKYCHNPDTWSVEGGRMMSADEILAEFDKSKNFYSSGGITVSGGEPMLQLDFLIELFTASKKKGIHNCLDTSGIVFTSVPGPKRDKIDKLMGLVDLVLLDLKHVDPKKHQELVKAPNKEILNFARYLSDRKIDVWIRHVVVPGHTDDPREWYKMGYFLAELRNIKALDVLPYHMMGVPKYKELDIVYPLEGIPEAPKELAQQAASVIMAAVTRRRRYLQKKRRENE